MRSVRLCVVCLLGAAVLTGCNSYQMAASRLGPASQIVSASIENLGWSKVFSGQLGTVSCTAVVTTYDKQGQKYTDRQKLVADLGLSTITANGATPAGTWTATADLGGLTGVTAQPGVNTALVRQRMGLILPTLLHRLRGPYNLVNGERPRTPEQTQVGGLPVVRVGVTGDNRNAVAYYFEPITGILKFVSAGADAPGADGTITRYEYRSLPNGTTFPTLIRVNHIGKHVLLGETPIFQVEISDVKYR